MKKIVKDIEIEILTGLHIGVGNDTVQIGGIDSTVIKDPITHRPYIPGSSLKGKIRCLLETEGEYGEMDDTINKYFGPTTEYLKTKKGDKNYSQTPTRFIFQDLFLDENEGKKFDRGELMTELKTEIKINRKEGKADNMGPRTIERVPPKTKFHGKILVRFTDDDELKKIENVLDKGIALVNNDFLGGSGSRGYGAVKIVVNKKRE